MVGTEVFGTMKQVLAGPRQTTPRAELTALILVVESFGKELALSEAPVYTDCSYVINGVWARARPGHKLKITGQNGDLWQRLERAMRKAGPQLLLHYRLRKVKAHTKQADWDAGTITAEQFAGNEAADGMAGEAARMNQVDPLQAKAVVEVETKAKAIIRSLLRTCHLAIQHAATQPKQQEVSAPGKPRGRPAKPKTPHAQEAMGEWWVCTRCWSRCPIEVPGGLSNYLPCKGEGSPAEGTPQPDTPHRPPSELDPLGHGGGITDDDQDDALTESEGIEEVSEMPALAVAPHSAWPK